MTLIERWEKLLSMWGRGLAIAFLCSFTIAASGIYAAPIILIIEVFDIDYPINDVFYGCMFIIGPYILGKHGPEIIKQISLKKFSQ